MDCYSGTPQCWLASKNLHSLDLYGHWMSSKAALLKEMVCVPVFVRKSSTAGTRLISSFTLINSFTKCILKNCVNFYYIHYLYTFHYIHYIYTCIICIYIYTFFHTLYISIFFQNGLISLQILKQSFLGL